MGDEIHYKGWRIDIMRREHSWEALVYRPSSPLHEVIVPKGPDQRVVIEEARALVDQLFAT